MISSRLETIRSGVPQGSVLGPLLFLIYLNDLENGIKSKIKFFADDTMLFSIVHDPAVSAAELNHDLNVINNWAKQWKMSFNPESTKQAIEIIFSQKRNEGNHPPLFFNGSVVTRELFHKHLGLILDSKLTFIEHVNEKVRIAKRFIGILKYLNNYLPTQTLSQIYKMYVRPHPDCGDVIYYIPHSESIFDFAISLHPLMDKVEQVQCSISHFWMLARFESL